MGLFGLGWACLGAGGVAGCLFSSLKVRNLLTAKKGKTPPDPARPRRSCPAPEAPSTPDRRAIGRVKLLELDLTPPLAGSDAPLQELLDRSASVTAYQLCKLAGAVVSGGRAVSGPELSSRATRAQGGVLTERARGAGAGLHVRGHALARM